LPPLKILIKFDLLISHLLQIGYNYIKFFIIQVLSSSLKKTMIVTVSNDNIYSLTHFLP